MVSFCFTAGMLAAIDSALANLPPMLSLWHLVESSSTSANLVQLNAESSFACTILCDDRISWIVKLASFLSADGRSTGICSFAPSPERLIGNSFVFCLVFSLYSSKCLSICKVPKSGVRTFEQLL